MSVSVIIPAFNEENSIEAVLREIPRDVADEIIVVDNGSTDSTAQRAASAMARVIREPRRGYGNACLRGISSLQQTGIVVFLDGDYSDHPSEMRLLVQPIIDNEADLVIGSRTRGVREKNALTPHARFGNWLASTLIRWFFGFSYTDLGPFRAIRYPSLMQLNMQDCTFGWTVEMQIKAIRHGLRILEVPVSYRKRIGKSKISGTVVGSVKAGTKIIWTILKYKWERGHLARIVLPFILFLSLLSPVSAQYKVEVQVVDLQVSVSDKQGNFATTLKPEDFLVWENEVPQEVLDVDSAREPFSIGILLDTSESMKRFFQISQRATQDFLHSLQDEDEFFVMTFDDRLLMKKDFSPAPEHKMIDWKSLRYGEETRLYDAVVFALKRLQSSRHPRRALFLISDGINTSGDGDLPSAIRLAQQQKTIIYGLVFEKEENQNAMRQLSETTGGTYFILYENLPRLQAAYEKIAADLAHRFTLYYRSRSDYSGTQKPEIKVKMKNQALRVRYQKTYYPK